MKSLLIAGFAVASLMLGGVAHASVEKATEAGCMKCHDVDKKKMASSFKDIAAKFKGMQYGVGTKGGAEVIVHQVRALVHDKKTARVICTLDCTNAFNSISREAVAKAICANPQFAPLVPLFLFEYERHSELVGHGFTMSSQSGVRQGSCLGPLWFALAIHDVVVQAVKPMRGHDVGVYLYLDDVTLIGPPGATTAAAFAVEAALKPLKLLVNRSKSEWMCNAGSAYRVGTRFSCPGNGA